MIRVIDALLAALYSQDQPDYGKIFYKALIWRFLGLGNVRQFFLRIGIFFILTVSLCTPSQARNPEEVPKYSIYEASLTTKNTYDNPYIDVTLSAIFQGPTRMITIEGFWDGGSTWKIRMAPTEVGTWTLVAVTSNDSQLNNQSEGITFTCRLPTDEEIADNEILRHGFIQVNPSYPHSFMYSDGTPFFFMGDTNWRIFLDNSFQDGAFQQIVDRRSAQGFNIFTVSYLGAESSLSNEGGPPFFGTHPSDELNPEYFRFCDKRIEYMNRRNIRPTILLGAPDGGLTKNIDWLVRLQRYIIARWAAYDIIWLGVKEYEEWGECAKQTINAIGDVIEQHDPYRHAASTHTINSTSQLKSISWSGNLVAISKCFYHNLTSSDNNIKQKLFSGYTMDWINFNTHQGRLLEAVLSDYKNFSKPVVVLEAYYRYPSTCSGAWEIDDTQEFINGLWGIQLHGGWNAGYGLVAGCNNDEIDYYLANLDHRDFDYHTYLKKFFNKTEFWKLKPRDDLIISGAAWAAAQLGVEYVVFLKDNTVTIDLSAASGLLPVEWYKPETGEFTLAGLIEGGAKRSFSSPSDGLVVLHIGEPRPASTLGATP